MGCCDYAGIDGPDPSVVNPITHLHYLAHLGVLQRIDDTDMRRMQSDQVRVQDITDGTSKTMIVAESSGRGATTDMSSGQIHDRGAWAEGANVLTISEQINYLLATDTQGQGTSDATARQIFSDHGAGAQVLFADNSVHWLDEQCTLQVLCALASRNGAETIPPDTIK